jgi:hypothetical protein
MQNQIIELISSSLDELITILFEKLNSEVIEKEQKILEEHYTRILKGKNISVVNYYSGNFLKEFKRSTRSSGFHLIFEFMISLFRSRQRIKDDF